jgi:NTE family protein
MPPLPGANKPFGIALGGGGSRALAHWGVLRALASKDLTPSWITGSSMGALVGALYASTGETETSYRRMVDYFQFAPAFGARRRPPKANGVEPRRGWWGRRAKSLAQLGIAAAISVRRSLQTNRAFDAAVDALVGDAAFEDLRLPFACVALDLSTGRVATFTRGPLAPALKAGAAVALVKPPVMLDGREYVDAAVAAAIPVSACRKLGAPAVLAVDVGSPFPEHTPLDTGFDVVWRLVQVTSKLLNDRESAGADWTLRPEVQDVFWGDFTRIGETVDAGAAAVHAANNPIAPGNRPGGGGA